MLFILNKLPASKAAASALVLALGALLGACGARDYNPDRVYSGRHYNAGGSFYTRFTEATGIR